MSQLISAVLFDLDGTLLDTAPDFIRIIKKMCIEQQLVPPSDEKIREQVSAGSKAMVHLMDETADVNDAHVQAQFEKFRQQFLAEYEQNICVDTCLYDGMSALLHKLEAQNIPWGIVTNKPRVLSELLLDALDLTQRCQVLVCPDDVENAKPHPEPMLLASDILQINSTEIMYVGDHQRDIEAGNATNMVTVLAKYGYLPPVKQDDGSYQPFNFDENQSILNSWHADYMIDNVNELGEMLWNTTKINLRNSDETDNFNS